MESTVEQPEPLTPEKAEAMSVLMKTAAQEFGPLVEKLVKEARENAADVRAADAREADARRVHERRGAYLAMTLQVVIMGSVAAGAIFAMASGQWAIAEKALFGLLGLGFGARLAR